MGVRSTQQSTPPPHDTPPARGSLIYAVGIALALLGVLAVALYGISSERSSSEPEPAPEPAQASAEPPPPPTPPLRDDATSAEQGERLGSLARQLAELAETSAALRKRVELLERELARRAAAPPAPAAPAPASSVPTDLEPLYERLSTIETGLQREGADRIQFQEDVLARVYKLEASRGEGEAARLSAQKAAEERVYKLEQRLHTAESQLVEAERRLGARVEKLEAR